MVARRRRGYRHFKLKISPESILSLTSITLLLLSVLTLISFFAQAAEFNNRLQDALNSFFGLGIFLVPPLLGLSGLLLMRSFRLPGLRLNHLLGLLIFTLSFVSLAHLFIPLERAKEAAALGQGGGYFGFMLSSSLRRYFSSLGAFFIAIAGLAFSWVVTFNTPLDKIFLFFSNIALRVTTLVSGFLPQQGLRLPKRVAIKTEETWEEEEPARAEKPEPKKTEGKKENALEILPLPAEPVTAESLLPVPVVPREKKTGPKIPELAEVWEYPPLSLLSEAVGADANRGDTNQNAALIEQALDSFGIRAKVVEINKGPAVTQYALESAQGTKIIQIKSLQNDLALALASPTGSVRIEAPIPGKSLIGIEVPNISSSVVTLKSILSSAPMKNSKSKLTVALGQDVAGDAFVADIGRMPHALVAGATGSGKSTMMHAFLSSLLFRASPSEVKLILVDTKRVELSEYNGIPHLLTPVINDPEKVLAALKWAIGEMDRRYRLFQSAKVRDLGGYNELSGFQALPYVIIMVDELADMMALAPVEAEKAICRLAQLSRATGIHLILSTQRPDVRVITGLIKANIPCRIAFNTVSQIDSRVIIDQAGSEKLLGRGDMLYVPPEASKPKRLQGVYVSPGELKKLIDFLKQSNFTPQYQEEITDVAPIKNTHEGGGEDELFAEAVRTVCQEGKASASLFQRRLRVGYARAARLIDELEARGIVSPGEGAKPRDVLIHDPEQVLGKSSAQQPEATPPTSPDGIEEDFPS
ncbi:MAG: DNA translocase FtsK 4TM domain-containing protein [Patescibacteria group bacterium]